MQTRGVVRRAVHCQLFVILARQAARGAIFRRGPSTWTQLIAWDTSRDVFERGQWFHGKLYERRADLSPTGDKLIYFVAKHHLRKVDASYTSAWTAVSKAPYFTALALWPNGGTTYLGGGLFARDDHLFVNAIGNRWSHPAPGVVAVHPKHAPPKRVRVSPIAFTSGDQLMAKRLVRDGWTLTSGQNLDADHLNLSGRLVRDHDGRRLQLDFGYQTMNYTLFQKQRGAWESRPFDDVSWADFDQNGRLVFAKNGTLFAARSEEQDGELLADALANFDEAKPTRVVAPRSAKTW